MSKETSGAASSTIGIADYVGMLALLGWVHRDEDGQGAEEALRGATKGRLGGASELDGELQMLNEKCLCYKMLPLFLASLSPAVLGLSLDWTFVWVAAATLRS